MLKKTSALSHIRYNKFCNIDLLYNSKSLQENVAGTKYKKKKELKPEISLKSLKVLVKQFHAQIIQGLVFENRMIVA